MVGGEEGFLRKVLRLVIVFDKLVADGEYQLFILGDELTKLPLCHAKYSPAFRFTNLFLPEPLTLMKRGGEEQYFKK